MLSSYDYHEQPKETSSTTIHPKTSRAAEAFVLEEAARRIQRAFRERKAHRALIAQQRYALSYQNADAVVDADVYSAALQGNAYLLRQLIARGGSVNTMGAFGHTPLHHAVSGGNIDCISLLIQHHANLDAQDAKGETPLHLAARSGRIDVIQTLTNASADRAVQNYAGKTPRALARRYANSLCVAELSVGLAEPVDPWKAKRHLAHIPTEDELKNGLLETPEVGDDDDDDDDEDMVRISRTTLSQLHTDISTYQETIKTVTARERLAQKRAHKWEQDYHAETEPLKNKTERLEIENAALRQELTEKEHMYANARSAITAAEKAKHQMFVKLRDKEYELEAVKVQVANVEKGFDYTKDRMRDQVEQLEEEVEKHRANTRDEEALVEDLRDQIRKLEMAAKHSEAYVKELEQDREDLKIRTKELKRKVEALKEATGDAELKMRSMETERQQLKEQNLRLNQNQAGMMPATMMMGAGAPGAWSRAQTLSHLQMQLNAPKKERSRRKHHHKHRKHKKKR